MASLAAWLLVVCCQALAFESGAHQPLQALPVDIGNVLLQSAINYGWHAVNVYADYVDDARKDQKNGDQNIADLRSKAKHLLSHTVVDLLREVAQLEGWYAAQSKNPAEQKQTGDKCNAAIAKLKKTKELSNDLCEQIRSMASYAAWYTFEVRHKGKQSVDAHRNWAKALSLLDGITGKVLQPLQALPVEITTFLFQSCINYGWHAVNVYSGYKGSAQQDQNKADGNIADLRNKAKNLLSDYTVDLLKEVAQLEGWYAAQSKSQEERKQTGDKCNAAIAKLKRTNELSNGLCEKIRQMATYAAHYTFESRDKGEKSQEAIENHAKAQSILDSIKGKVLLKALSIRTDDARMAFAKPITIAEHTLENRGNTPQTQKYAFSHTVGKTTTWNNQLGVEIGIENTLTVGATFAFGASTTYHFSATYQHSWGGSLDNTETKTYEFPLTAPPHSTYRMTATVQEVAIDAEYMMTFSIGGHEYIHTGRWDGLAVSKMIATVTPVSDSPSSSHPQADGPIFP